MILVYAVVLLILVALLLRRDLGSIASLPYRGGWKLSVAIAGLVFLQGLVVYGVERGLVQMWSLILSQVSLVLLLFVNRHLPGAKIFALGVVFNTVVMVANGGWMPLTPEMRHYIYPERLVEIEAKPADSKNIILDREDTRLWLLSDIVKITLPWRRNAVSVGDLLLVVGVAQFLLRPSRLIDTSGAAAGAAGGI